jgi:hypothetical protein
VVGATVVEIASTVRPDLRADVDRLIRFGFEEVEPLGVEVHVRVGRPRVVWVLVTPPDGAKARHRGCRLTASTGSDWLRKRGLWPEGAGSVLYGWSRRRSDLQQEAAVHGLTPIRVELRRDLMRGLAYAGVPDRARTSPGTRYLVTVKIPAHPDREGGYPLVSAYRKTIPVELHDWRHNLLHVAAHEACHVWQFEHELPRSEVEAERWGIAAAGRAGQAGLLPVQYS